MGGGGPFEIEVTTTVAASATLFDVYESQALISAAAADHELEALNNTLQRPPAGGAHAHAAADVETLTRRL